MVRILEWIPGTYNSAKLLLSAVINTSTTGESTIPEIENAQVPLYIGGRPVLKQNNKRLKHRFKMTIPILDRDENDHPGEYKKYKITIGGKMGCEIEPASYVRSQSGETFTCLADFDTASPLFQPGQKAEIVVETIPYGYTYSRQNAVEFVLAEQTFNYTGTLELHKNLPRL